MMDPAELTRRIMAIQRDTSLTEEQKAKKRQELMSGKWAQKPEEEEPEEKKGEREQARSCRSQRGWEWAGHQVGGAEPSCRPPAAGKEPLPTQLLCSADAKGKAAKKEAADTGLDDTLQCTICHDLCVRPVTVRGAAAQGAQALLGLAHCRHPALNAVMNFAGKAAQPKCQAPASPRG